jgi:hypothetical protein
MKPSRVKIAAAAGACTLAVLIATTGYATARKKAHTIPTGTNAEFTLDVMTFYGFFDNSPPGTDIAHPVIHSGAGGVGTFQNPITFAVAPKVQDRVPPGTIMYVPSLRKYFITEDNCSSNVGVLSPGQLVPGCDGELPLGTNEFDLWIGG